MHGERENHDPQSNAVYLGQVDFAGAQEIVAGEEYLEDYAYIQDMEDGEALGVRCLCGRGCLALMMASTFKSPNGRSRHYEEDEKKKALFPQSMNSYLKSVRRQLHSVQPGQSSVSLGGEKRQLIDKCSVCMKVLQLYRSDSDTLATQKLRNHALTHLPKYWQCPLCDQAFQRRNDVVAHLEKRHQQKIEPLCSVDRDEYDIIVSNMLNKCFPDLQTMPVNRKLIKSNEYQHKELPPGTTLADLNRQSPGGSGSTGHTGEVDSSSLGVDSPMLRFSAGSSSLSSCYLEKQSAVNPKPTNAGGVSTSLSPAVPGELTPCVLCKKKLQLNYRGSLRHFTRMKNHALTHMDAYWMCPVCHTSMHRRSDLANHLAKHDQEGGANLAPVLTIDEDEFQRMVQETIEECFPEGGDKISQKTLESIPVIESRKKFSFGSKSYRRAIKQPTKGQRPLCTTPPAEDSHLYAGCDECGRVLKLWKNRRHGIPWTGMANHALTHLKNYWHCALCKNSYQRKDDAFKHSEKYHSTDEFAACSIPEEDYDVMVRDQVRACWISVLKENPGSARSSVFKGMVVLPSGKIQILGKKTQGKNTSAESVGLGSPGGKDGEATASELSSANDSTMDTTNDVVEGEELPTAMDSDQ